MLHADSINKVSLQRQLRCALVFTSLLAATTGVLCASACNRRDPQGPPGASAPVAKAAPDHIVYPDSLHVDYAPVDTFIRDALATCLRGDYEAFRLLWSTKQDPLRREEFEQGWQAVKTIRIRAVEKVVLPNREPFETSTPTQDASSGEMSGIAPDVSFVLLAEADFDTTHPIGKKQPHRDIVLLVMREQDGWRFGRAPERIRNWIKSRATEDHGASSEEVAPASRTTESIAIDG